MLGLNGSGKSSLISELSPLPANKEDFFEGGYKCIVIEHNGNTYSLISDIENNSYSFLLGEEELNPSNLVTIQRELVYKHFGLNQDIWDILIGKVNFTDMTLISRKKLFNTLSHLNVETILDIYSEQKEAHKVQQALLKTQSNLYTIESNKLLDLTLLDGLQSRLSRNNEAMSALMDIRATIAPHTRSNVVGSGVDTYKQIRCSITDITNKYWTLLTAFPYSQCESNKSAIGSRIDLHSYRLKDLYTYMESLQLKYKTVELKKKNSKLSIEESIGALQSLVDNHSKNLVYLNELSNGTQNDVHTLYYALVDIVSEIPLNDNKLYSRANYDTALSNKNALLTEKQTQYNLQLYLAKEIDLLDKQKQDDKVTCPSCNTSWVLNYDAAKHTSMLERKAVVDSKLVDVEDRLAIENKYLEEFSEYMSKYRIYGGIRTNYIGKLPELFSVIDKEEYIFHAPRSILTVVNTAIDDVNSLTEIVKHKQAITSLIGDLELISNSEGEDESTILSEMSNTTDKVTELLQLKEVETNNLVYNATSYKISTHILSLEKALNDATTDIQHTNLSYTLKGVISSIDFELNTLKMQNIDIQTQVSSHANLTAVVSKYKQDIEDTTSNIEVLKAICDELNPKSGIIGKIISNYLNSIIVYVNKIISSLWNYKMELVAYNLESDVLDYRFKINVEDKLPVKDISLASSGMKEIINLSFKLAMMKLLGLNDFPLYLDEFGARLDTEHRSNVYNLIFKFLNDDHYSQIYLITHTDLSYSNFKDTQVITLS